VKEKRNQKKVQTRLDNHIYDALNEHYKKERTSFSKEIREYFMSVYCKVRKK